MSFINEPRVSIGLPVYNGGDYIEETLASIFSQTFTDFELIISDNASTDSTEEICRKATSGDDRVRYIRQSNNIGGNQNYKYVLGQASCEYFIWMAADDLQDEDFLENLVLILDLNPSVGLAMGDVRNIDADGELTSTDRLLGARLVHQSDSAKIQSNFFRNPMTAIFFAFYGLFRTKILKSISLNYRNKVKYDTGWEIPVLAQIAVSTRIATTDTTFKLYRRHESSMYHQEISKFRSRDFLDNQLNISVVLSLIVFESRIRLIDKVRLYSLISFDIFRLVLKFVVKGALRIA